MSSQLTSDQLNYIMIESLVLSTALIERFEMMEENGLVAHKAKQSTKSASKFLQIYVDKVFDVSGESEDTKSHMKKGASHISELGLRMEKSLKTNNLSPLSDRIADLKKIINLAPLLEIQKEHLQSKIIDSGILEY